MLSAFRRKFEASGGPGPAAQAPSSASSEPAPSLDREMVDVLEADVLKAIRAVTEAISATSGDVVATAGDLDRIHVHMGELATAGRGAAGQTTALAASIEELAATSGDITGAMQRATVTIGQAVDGARDANALIAELARATEEIVGIVDTIAAVARQTNLLALNATIEAARAGVAGRGFAVVASEVKSLSVETTNAANDIRSRIGRLRDSAGASIGAVERVVEAIGEVQPVFGTVRDAVGEQTASVAELARRATEASSFVERVSERAQQVDAAAQSATDRMAHASAAASRADALAESLVQRFTAVMRQNEVGDRRLQDRFPTDRKVTLRHAGREHATATVDVSLGGFLVKPAPGLVLRPGAAIEARIAEVGPLPAEVTSLSAMGVHCRLAALEPEVHGAYARLVAEVEEEYRPLIRVARDAAERVRLAMEQAVTQGRLTREQLFDVDYRPIPGTSPQQFETASLAVLEDALPEILEPLLISDNSMVFCIAVDRNGYIPVHNRRWSQPQRPGETDWNTAHCRNRRIFDDRAGIAAARSTRPFLVQAYARDMGGGNVVLMREIDAPIRVFGRHWGGFRTAYRL